MKPLLSYIEKKALISYFIAFAIVQILFFNFTSVFLWQAWGIIEVMLFFHFCTILSHSWAPLPSKLFSRRLFGTSFLISAIYVTFTYFLYIYLRGEPFEYDPTDGLGYHESAVWFLQLYNEGKTEIYYNFLDTCSIDDRGYQYFLSFLYLIIGDNIFLTRIFKSLCRAYMCILIYRLGSRHFGEQTGRLAGIFCMLLPHFSFYAASHRKEAEMIMIVVWCIERADYIAHKQNLRIKDMILPFTLLIILFTLRTVLGVSVLFAFFMAFFWSNRTTISRKNKLILTIILGTLTIAFSGGMFADQINELYERKQNNAVEHDREWRTKTNSYVKYASAAVFAPMIFVIPFPSMIDIENQENQQRLNGGYFIKNILAFFAMAALFFSLKKKTVKKHLIIFSYTLCYLGIIAISNFAHSERFHLPALPFIMLLAAFGISQTGPNTLKWFRRYAFIMAIIVVLWNAFKLGGRGLI